MSRTRKEKEKIVYIVGAIASDPYYFEKFKKAEKKLREEGYECVINPTCLPDNLPYGSYAPISIAFVEVSDMVFVLKNYKGSIGTQAEIAYARMAGKEIIYEEEKNETV